MAGKPQRICKNGHDKDVEGRGTKGDCKRCRRASQSAWRAMRAEEQGRVIVARPERRTNAPRRKKVSVPPQPVRKTEEEKAQGKSFDIFHKDRPSNLAEADAAEERRERLWEQREERRRKREAAQ